MNGKIVLWGYIQRSLQYKTFTFNNLCIRIILYSHRCIKIVTDIDNLRCTSHFVSTSQGSQFNTVFLINSRLFHRNRNSFTFLTSFQGHYRGEIIKKHCIYFTFCSLRRKSNIQIFIHSILSFFCTTRNGKSNIQYISHYQIS